ncbi:hypothetical protein CHCC15543_2981 [Bacillus licheniformis]|nr:hypothetical protein CHCC15543_2981 [Bacillus licheniformis]
MKRPKVRRRRLLLLLLTKDTTMNKRVLQDQEQKQSHMDYMR